MTTCTNTTILQSSPILQIVVEHSSQKGVAVDHLGQVPAHTHESGGALVHGFELGFGVVVAVDLDDCEVVVWSGGVEASDVEAHVAVLAIAKIGPGVLLQFILLFVVFRVVVLVEACCLSSFHFFKLIVVMWHQHERENILFVLILSLLHCRLVITLTQTNIRTNKSIRVVYFMCLLCLCLIDPQTQ